MRYTTFLKHKQLKVLKEILHDTSLQMKESQLLTVASSLAYTTILSVIPVLAVAFSIFQAFGGIEKLYQTLEPMILENLAQGTSEDVMVAIRRFLSNIHGGALGAGGLVGLIFTCMSMLLSIENAFNRIWKAPTSRPIFYRIASYWLFITLGPLALSIAVGIATSSSLPLTKFLPSGTGMFVIFALVFSLAYKYVPNRAVHWAPALISGALTALGWNLARLAYAMYTHKVVSYDKVYGSLGAIPILLLWVYIAWVIVLAGASLTAALQRRVDFK
jgi:membrane protein